MWYEIQLDTQSAACEAIYPILYDLGLSGIVTQDPNDPMYRDGYQGDWDYFEPEARQFDYDGARLIAYIELDEAPEALIAELKRRVLALRQFDIAVAPADTRYRLIVEADWANEWKKYYKPHHITDRIVVVPQWESYQPSATELTIVLNPGKAFGTGTHQTTGLCAGFIARYAPVSKRLYDVGCGSGILAIIGRKLGIKEVYGVDVSTDAIAASMENMQLNDMGDIDFKLGDMSSLPAAPADLIVANIIADVIVDLAPQLAAKLTAQGHFIGSGILNERLDAVADALTAAGLTVVERATRGEWSAIVAKVRHE